MKVSNTKCCIHIITESIGNKTIYSTCRFNAVIFYMAKARIEMKIHALCARHKENFKNCYKNKIFISEEKYRKFMVLK